MANGTRISIHEIFEGLKQFTGEGSQTKKVEWLRQHDSPTLRMILQHSFDPKIVYNLPDGDVPFAKNPKPNDFAETNLRAETRKLSYLWLVPQDPNNPDQQPETPQARAEKAHADIQELTAKLTGLNARIEEYERLMNEAKVERVQIIDQLNNAAERRSAAQQNVLRLETLYIQLLEALSGAEADIAVAMKNKTLQKLYPINKKIVSEAFPELI